MELPGDLHESSSVSSDGVKASQEWGKVAEVRAEHNSSKCAGKERKEVIAGHTQPFQESFLCLFSAQWLC